MTKLRRFRTAKATLTALLFSTLLVSMASADEPGFTAIFNGKDLTGWRLGSIELAGKTATDDGRFAVKDGVLVISRLEGHAPKNGRDRHGGVV